MDRQTLIDSYVAKLDALGSSEVVRHLGVALDRSAERARDGFREQMRQVLGRGRSGARALLGGTALSAYTVNAVNYRPIAFRGGMTGDDLRTEVYLNASQGKTGRDQSAYLKYQFGEGEQSRAPGDVGLSDDQINVLQPEAIVLTQHLDDVTATGRQRRGLMAYLRARAAHRSKESRHQIMGDVARTRGVAMRDDHILPIGDRLANSRRLYGDAALRGRVERGNRSAVAVAHAIRANNRAAADHGALDHGVFKAPDWSSGLPAFFARPLRVVDPAGGYRTFTRRDGTTGRFPRMLAIAPEYGAIGKAAGPRALTLARSRVSYAPKLEGPWEAIEDIATEDLAEALAAEYAHAVERMEQGRSF